MITDAEMQEFLTDRDTALRSLDRPTIIAYYRKYGEMAVAARMARADDTIFLASVHRARLTLDSFTEAEKAVSRQWLAEHDFELRGF